MEKVIRQNSDLRAIDSCDLEVVWTAARSSISAAVQQIFPRYECVLELAKTQPIEETELSVEVSREKRDLSRTPSEPLDLSKRAIPERDHPDPAPSEPAEKETEKAPENNSFRGMNLVGPLNGFVNVKSEGLGYGETVWSEEAEIPRTLRVVLHDADNFRQVTVVGRGLLHETWQLPDEPAKPILTKSCGQSRQKGRFYVVHDDVPFLFKYRTFPIREDGEILFTEEIEALGGRELPLIGLSDVAAEPPPEPK
ncbi:UNVERIFIED_CONTAM: hypothetical protein PYX00_000278 [Menopon gallinae]|uniref:Uncharacterized protein n=1 Tax=Menopon gallinae TaxID=328185 RepID=A0AAW2I953_9NEOP